MGSEPLESKKMKQKMQGWYGFLPNQGNLDQKSGKIQPFVRGLASISLKFGNFDVNVAQRTGLKN